MDSAPSFNFLQKLPRPPQLGVTPRLTERSGAWRRRVASLTPGWYRARICPRVPAPGPSNTIAAGDRPSLVPGDLVRGLQLHRAVSASRMPWWSQPQRRMGPASCSMCGTGGRAAAEGRAMGQPGAQLGRTAQEPRPLPMAQMPSLPPLCSPLPLMRCSVATVPWRRAPLSSGAALPRGSVTSASLRKWVPGEGLRVLKEETWS